MSFLTKVKSLSPEELDATKQRLASDDAFAKKFQGGIDTLIAADKQELKALLTGQPVDTSKVPQGQVENKLTQEVIEQEPNADKQKEEGLLAAGLATVKDGLVGIGSGLIPPQINAGINAGLGEAAEFVGLAEEKTFKERFDGSLKTIQGQVDSAKERSPIASGGGQLVGTVAGVAVPAAGALSRVNKLTKAIGVAEKSFKAKAAGVAAVTGTDFIVGSLQLQAAKGEHSVEEMADSMKESAMYAAVGGSVGVALSGAGKVYQIAQNSQFRKLQMSRGVQKMYNSVRKFVADSEVYSSGRNAIDEKRYIKTLSDAPGYNAAVDSGDMIKATKIVNAEVGKKVTAKAAAYNALGEAGVATPKAAIKDIGSEILDSVDTFVKDGGTFSKSKLETLKNKFGALDNIEGDTLNLQTVEDLLNSKAVQDIAKLDDGAQLLGKFRNIIHTTVDGAAGSNNKAIAGLADNVREINKDLQILKHNGKSASKITRELKDVSERGVFSQVLGEASNSLGNSPNLVQSVIRAPEAALSTGQAVLYNIGKQGRNLRNFVSADSANIPDRIIKLSDMYTTGGAQKTRIGQLLISGLGRMQQQNSTTDEMMSHIETMEASAKLLQSPIDRNTGSYQAKKQSLKQIAKTINPGIKKTLDDLDKNGENAGPVLEQIANHPLASEIFKPGTGWDGKTYDPATKSAIINQINLLPNTVGNSVMKKKLIEDLNVSGTIPDLEKLPKRTPRSER